MRCTVCGKGVDEGGDVHTLASGELPRDLRIWHIIGDKRRGLPALVPVSRSTWWEGIKQGKYPAGHKHSARVTVWRREDILRLLKSRKTTDFPDTSHIKPWGWNLSVMCAACHDLTRQKHRRRENAAVKRGKKRKPRQRAVS